jgi:hypothetical protein
MAPVEPDRGPRLLAVWVLLPCGSAGGAAKAAGSRLRRVREWARPRFPAHRRAIGRVCSDSASRRVAFARLAGDVAVGLLIGGCCVLQPKALSLCDTCPLRCELPRNSRRLHTEQAIRHQRRASQGRDQPSWRALRVSGTQGVSAVSLLVSRGRKGGVRWCAAREARTVAPTWQPQRPLPARKRRSLLQGLSFFLRAGMDLSDVEVDVYRAGMDNAIRFLAVGHRRQTKSQRALLAAASGERASELPGKDPAAFEQMTALFAKLDQAMARFQ